MVEDSSRNLPEEQAREKIDEKMAKAGWVELTETENTTGYRTEVKVGQKFADYVLFVEGSPLVIVEAKPNKGSVISAIDQATQYAQIFDGDTQYAGKYGVPFVVGATGEEVLFRDLRPGSPPEIELNDFHTPSGIEKLLRVDYPSAKQKLVESPIADFDRGLWDHQKDCIGSIENGLQDGKRRMLIQMATGAGKTRMAAAQSYRLLDSGFANRILFIPDTRNLAEQAHSEFVTYAPPDSFAMGDKFRVTNLEEDEEELFNSDVVVTTLQKMYSLIEKREDFNGFDPDTFDVVISDECHRTIFNEYGVVLNSFDATQIGLTATPSGRAIEYFGESIYTYNYDEARKDNHVVPFNLHRIKTRITMEGIKNDAGEVIHTPSALGDTVLPKGTHEVVGEEYRKNSGSDGLALVFARNNVHADSIVKHFRQGPFSDKPDEYVQKITSDVQDPSGLLKQFKDPHMEPHIAVTVQLISTGVDIKPLENIILLRPVRSPVLYNQMMGRGTRTYDGKDHFTIYDCVGASEYFDGNPPFNTENYDPEHSESNGDGESEPKTVVEVRDPDDLRESQLVFPTTDGRELSAEEYIGVFENYIEEHREEYPLNKIEDNEQVVSDADIFDLKETLADTPEFFTETRMQQVYDVETATLYDIVYSVLTGGEITTPAVRADKAIDSVEESFDLDSKEVVWVERMYDALRVGGEITKKHFAFPPMSDCGEGWRDAVDDFGSEERLQSVMDALKTEFYN